MKVSIHSRSQWLSSLKPEFREFPREDWQTLDIADVRGVDVEEATTERFVGARNEFLEPSALSTADLDFGRLTESEFGKLKSEFGSLSEVGFRPDRDYEAADFLPPVVQALLNQDLEIPEPVVLPESADYAFPPVGDDLPVDLTANCHGTAWEAMRSFQGHNDAANIFLGDALVMDDALRTDKFQKIGESGKDEPQGLKPGDVVAFDEVSEWARMTMLLHTAVYVGGGLFFEKPNTESDGEDSPYRLATWEMLTAPVNDYVDGKFTAQAYRPTAKLDRASEMFKSDQLDEWQQEHGRLDKPVLTVMEPSMGGGVRGMWSTAMASVPLEKQPDGRYALS
jgi:hypothetical protein